METKDKIALAGVLVALAGVIISIIALLPDFGIYPKPTPTASPTERETEYPIQQPEAPVLQSTHTEPQDGQPTSSEPTVTSTPQIHEMFKDVLLSDPFLMTDMVDVKEVDGKRYVISVGVTANEAQSVQVADAYLNMLKVATVKAEAEIAKFIQTDISTETILETSTETTVDIERQKRSLRVREILSEMTTTRAREALKKVQRVGTWYSDDMSLFYVAVAMPVDE